MIKNKRQLRAAAVERLKKSEEGSPTDMLFDALGVDRGVAFYSMYGHEAKEQLIDLLTDDPCEHITADTLATALRDCDKWKAKAESYAKALEEMGCSVLENGTVYPPSSNFDTQTCEKFENTEQNAENVQDTRERLEKDISRFSEMYAVLGTNDSIREHAIGWLDRQAAITEREHLGLTISDDESLINWHGENYLLQSIALNTERKCADDEIIYGFEFCDKPDPTMLGETMFDYNGEPVGWIVGTNLKDNSEHDADISDNQEKLEEDVRVRFGDGLVHNIVMRLLDRQAAITEQECENKGNRANNKQNINISDSREKLEIDVIDSFKTLHEPEQIRDFWRHRVIEWLNRQAAITEQECEQTFLDRGEKVIMRREMKERELLDEIDCLKAHNDYLSNLQKQIMDEQSRAIKERDEWKVKAKEYADTLENQGYPHGEYMKRPKGKDGKFIHVGDRLVYENQIVNCLAITSSRVFFLREDSGIITFDDAENFSQSKPQAIEDVIYDAMSYYSNDDILINDDVVQAYADMIRRMVIKYYEEEE